MSSAYMSWVRWNAFKITQCTAQPKNALLIPLQVQASAVKQMYSFCWSSETSHDFIELNSAIISLLSFRLDGISIFELKPEKSLSNFNLRLRFNLEPYKDAT